eukprot:TRINITY_DN2021_c0_g1_i1.p1 TRINITY_DN2021_c0_g1~~TRINITY_DN2021_c0_g1_i1.p1  ORF type:complete len:483 (+),score=75.61 TRINITY_DN2021_c0_g1_i1:43-1449(+)
MPVRGGQFVDSDDEEEEDEDGEAGEDAEEEELEEDPNAEAPSRSNRPIWTRMNLSATSLQPEGQEDPELQQQEEAELPAGEDSQPSVEPSSDVNTAPQPVQANSFNAETIAHQDPQAAAALSNQDGEERPAAMDSLPEQENISGSMDDHVDSSTKKQQSASPSRTSTSPLPGRQKNASPKKALERPRPLKEHASGLAQDKPPVSQKVPLDTFGVHQDVFLHTCSKHRSMPLLTMSPKLPSSFIRTNSNPAPDSYKPVDGSRTSKFIDRPRYSIPAAQRFPREEPLSKKQPGPGHYPVNKFEKFKYSAQPTSSFGSCARGRSNPVREYGPGPGEYEVRGNPAKDGPMFAMQGKARKRGPLNYEDPGPGAYDPKTVICEPMMPKAGFGTSLREDYEAKRERNIPGPGAYDVHLLNLLGSNTAKFSVGTRRKKLDLSSHLTPGPGFYNCGTSFGYASTVPRKVAPVAGRTF